MRANKEFTEELERHFKTYHSEVNQAFKNGFLKDNTAHTYLLHSGNFIKWIKDDFEPGARNK